MSEDFPPPLTDHDMSSNPVLLKPSAIFSIAFNGKNIRVPII